MIIAKILVSRIMGVEGLGKKALELLRYTTSGIDGDVDVISSASSRDA